MRSDPPLLIKDQEDAVIADLRLGGPITVRNCHGVRIEDVHLRDVRTGDAIRLEGCSDVTIRNCSVIGARFSGIALQGPPSRGVRIENVYLEDCQLSERAGNAAIQTRASTDLDTKNHPDLTISRCFVVGSRVVGLGLDASDQVTVRATWVVGSGNEGIAFTGRDITIEDNVVAMAPEASGACIVCWADRALEGRFNEDVVIARNVLRRHQPDTGQVIALVCHGPQQVIRRVVVADNDMSGARHAVQAYTDATDGQGPSGSYGLEDVRLVGNDADTPSLVNVPARWPKRDISVVE